jgi:hypothetical protein
MSAEDWLVALNDAFTARLRHCTVCGRRAPEVDFDIAHSGVPDVIGGKFTVSCN